MDICQALREKILILDGGMGTMIQQYGLDERAYRGTRFADHGRALHGDNDVLVLTKPDVIRAIHRAYLEAGADIIETCSFNANRLSQKQYGLESCVRDLNLAAVRVAREAADESGKSCFVAGSIGPTGTSLSLASDVDHPENRELEFDEMAAIYEEQIDALLEGGVDALLFETIFDTLTTKAALYAAEKCMEKRNQHIPVMISMSVADSAGRLLCGQKLEAFAASIRPYHPISIGLNCSFGVRDMGKYLPRLAEVVLPDTAISCYPNAGLPDANGNYDDDARLMASELAAFARRGLLNIVGGCCGTTPEHIRAIADELRDIQPRKLETHPELEMTVFSGLERFAAKDYARLIVAERANVTGSRKFKRLVEQQKWDDAIDVAREQMNGGAQLVDICMDDAMIDACAMMKSFLRRIAAEPEISRYPVVIDSSDFKVIQTALRECQGRCLVNSISLKFGEKQFLDEAREIQRLGCAAVVMAFDENGQASTTERRVEILSRAVSILIEKLNFRTCDIVVDPNILAIGTGLEEHNRQAVSFIESCRTLRTRFPGIQTIGGLSNLSFSFRGRDDVRGAIHKVFLEEAGSDLTMVIANPQTLNAQFSEDLLALARNLVLAEPGALEALLDWMNAFAPQGKKEIIAQDEMAEMPPEKRIHEALIRGIPRYIEQDVQALAQNMSPLQIVEGPLMAAMNDIGDRFGRGEMFLPQIVRAARLMKQAISALNIEKNSVKKESTSKKILLATVWGDVHDIGKNIVNIVMSCNGFEVIDLGVMVETDRIVSEAIAHHVDAVGLSGLISPSLGVMVEVARALKKAGVRVPLMVGGAATSEAHVALKLEPAYWPGLARQTSDASRIPGVLGPWLDPSLFDQITQENARRYREIREKSGANDSLRSLNDSRRMAVTKEVDETLKLRLDQACQHGLYAFDWPAADLENHLNWHRLEKILGKNARELGHQLIRDLSGKTLNTKIHVRFVRASAEGDDIALLDEHGNKIDTIFGFRAQQTSLEPLALADYAVSGAIGLFALNTSIDQNMLSDDLKDSELALSALSGALVDAAADLVQQKMFGQYGNYICPACGYPISPDHTQKKIVLSLCRADEIGISLTESMMMDPLASICGFALIHPDAKYFNMGRIGDDQWADYAKRRQMPEKDVRRWCGQ